jgi:hypothetical protein
LGGALGQGQRFGRWSPVLVTFLWVGLGLHPRQELGDRIVSLIRD